MLRKWWVPVAGGGALGTLARVGMDEIFGSTAIIDPAMVTANLVGAFLLGAFVGVASRRHVTDAAQHFLGPGLLASFTTYSAFAVAIARHMAAQDIVAAAGAAGAIVVLGVVAAVIGVTLGKRLTPEVSRERRT